MYFLFCIYIFIYSYSYLYGTAVPPLFEIVGNKRSVRASVRSELRAKLSVEYLTLKAVEFYIPVAIGVARHVALTTS